MNHASPRDDAGAAPLRDEVQRRIQSRTGRRIRNLTIELHPNRVVLHGQTATYYLKQLAQHGVLELLPGTRVENAITVEVPAGMPQVGALSAL